MLVCCNSRKNPPAKILHSIIKVLFFIIIWKEKMVYIIGENRVLGGFSLSVFVFFSINSLS